MKVHYVMPYQKGDIGAAYNYEMERIPNDDDWACFMDIDAMILTPSNLFDDIIHEYIEAFPDTGIFTCVTNRMTIPPQLYSGKMDPDPNVINHGLRALEYSVTRRGRIKNIKQPIAGVMMVIKKSMWKKLPFPTGKVLDIDMIYSGMVLDRGLRILRMEALYVFHYYRFHKDTRDKSHLVCE